MERVLLTYPTYERYVVLSHVIRALSVRERRVLFQLARSAESTPDLLFPRHGFTLSEFAVWNIVNDLPGC